MTALLTNLDVPVSAALIVACVLVTLAGLIAAAGRTRPDLTRQPGRIGSDNAPWPVLDDWRADTEASIIEALALLDDADPTPIFTALHVERWEQEMAGDRETGEAS